MGRGPRPIWLNVELWHVTGPSSVLFRYRGPFRARAYPGTVSERENDSNDNEAWKARGVFLRVFIYVFATHLFAGFIWILFHVGEHAQK